MIVIDSSALLAVLKDETGASAAAEYLSIGLMSTVNFSETLAKAADWGADIATTKRLIEEFGLTFAPLDSEQAITAAELRPITRYMNVSLADRACLALAQVRKLPVLTADTKWNEIPLGIDIRMIR